MDGLSGRTTRQILERNLEDLHARSPTEEHIGHCRRDGLRSKRIGRQRPLAVARPGG